MWIIQKSADHKAAEEAFLKFISEVSNDRGIPVKINEKYKAQIEASRKQIAEGK